MNKQVKLKPGVHFHICVVCGLRWRCVDTDKRPGRENAGGVEKIAFEVITFPVSGRWSIKTTIHIGLLWR